MKPRSEIKKYRQENLLLKKRIEERAGKTAEQIYAERSKRVRDVIELREPDRAKQIFREILERLGESAGLRILFGRAYRETEHWTDAVAEFKVQTSSFDASVGRTDRDAFDEDELACNVHSNPTAFVADEIAGAGYCDAPAFTADGLTDARAGERRPLGVGPAGSEPPREGEVRGCAKPCGLAGGAAPWKGARDDRARRHASPRSPDDPKRSSLRRAQAPVEGAESTCAAGDRVKCPG